MFQQNNHNIILLKYFESVKRKGSSLALPANGLGGSRATSSLVAHFALQNTKFGSEKGKVQKPARIPPQTPPSGGTEAEAGQFHSPRKIVCPAESKLVFRIFVKKCSNFVQKTPPIFTFCEIVRCCPCPSSPVRRQRQGTPYILCIPVWHITLWNITYKY